jgi:predicted  nucleic acid-binding Zn-ribbon protein
MQAQSVDLRLNDVRARLATFPKKLAELDARVAAARHDLDQSKAAQLATIKDRKKYELDVEQWKEKARKYRDQTSQIKTNDAYKALQHEIQLSESEISKAEDRLLEQMVAAEEYDRRIKASEKRLKEIEEIVRADRTGVEAEKSGAEKQLAELNTERTHLVAEIPEDLRDHYERIAKKHNGVALAEVRDEKCTACGMRVRPHVFQEMRRADSTEMFHCETCTRILYYVEPAAAPAPAPAAPAPTAASATSSSES